MYKKYVLIVILTVTELFDRLNCHDSSISTACSSGSSPIFTMTVPQSMAGPFKNLRPSIIRLRDR